MTLQPQEAIATTSQYLPQEWHPRVLWVGVGCQRHTPRTVIEKAIQQVLQTHQLPEEAVAGIASINLKADETGLVELCQERNWQFCTFTADVLQQVQVPTPSHMISQKIGTFSVAEAAALQAAGVEQLLVSKQIYRCHQPPPATNKRMGQGVTVAIAQTQHIDSFYHSPEW